MEYWHYYNAFFQWNDVLHQCNVKTFLRTDTMSLKQDRIIRQERLVRDFVAEKGTKMKEY